MRTPSIARRAAILATLAAALTAGAAAHASAAEFMCDPAWEDCRAKLIERIKNEATAIDIAMLFMEDDVLADEIIARHAAGVRIRMLIEPRRNATTPKNL